MSREHSPTAKGISEARRRSPGDSRVDSFSVLTICAAHESVLSVLCGAKNNYTSRYSTSRRPFPRVLYMELSEWTMPSSRGNFGFPCSSLRAAAATRPRNRRQAVDPAGLTKILRDLLVPVASYSVGKRKSLPRG